MESNPNADIVPSTSSTAIAAEASVVSEDNQPVQASALLHQLCQRVEHLEAELVSLRRENTKLEQQNKELASAQSRVPDVESQLTSALAQVEELATKRQKHEQSSCTKCKALEGQQAEIEAAFVELKKLCSALFTDSLQKNSRVLHVHLLDCPSSIS